MRRICLAIAVLAAVLHRAAPAADEDKARLFNTFYLDGDRVTYVLTMRKDRTFDLYGPDGSHAAGTIRCTDEYVTFTAGDVKRYFRFGFRSHDVKLGCRENDKAVKGSLLGELPPVNDREVHTLYVSEGAWLKKGRPLFKPHDVVARSSEPTSRLQEPVVRAPNQEVSSPPSVPGSQPAVSFDDVAGTYYPNGKKDECLVIIANGCFGYVPVEGAAQNGTLLRTGGEISFVGPDCKRHFALRLVPSGFELTRRLTDVTKPADVLGRMPPQGNAPVVWMKAKEPGDQPAAQQPLAQPAAQPAPPGLAAPAAVAPPADTKSAAAPPQPAPLPVKDVQAIVGAFVYKPNPFLAETLAIAADGSFTYKDSNGANATGKLSFEGDVLVFSSGEGARRFTASLEGPGLTLTCAKNDTTELKNDLGAMSPTALKTARYEKK